MSIVVSCQCGKKFAAPENLAGKKVKCPSCGQPIIIPAAGPTKPATVPQSGNITVSCQCGKRFSAPPNLAGKNVKCPGCGQPIAVPGSPRPVASEPAENPDVFITAKCNCGKVVQAKVALAGKKVRCPACSSVLAIPSGSPAATPSDSPAPRGADFMVDLLDELGLEATSKGTQRCPGCKSVLPAEAVLCVKCGFNLELGQHLKTGSFVKHTATTTPIGPPTRASQEGGQKQRHRGGGTWDQAPGSVKGIAIYFYISCGLCVLGLLVNVFNLITLITNSPSDIPIQAKSVFIGMAVGVIALYSLFAYLNYWVASSIVRGSSAARITAIVLGALGVCTLVGLIPLILGLSQGAKNYCRG